MSARILLVSILDAPPERVADPLTALGHVVTTITNPSVARREAASHELVIVDAGAPAGLVEACRRLRDAAPSGLPIMAIAHSDDIEERVALVTAGADDVLVQPFDPRELELLVEALLSRSRPAAAEDHPSDGPDVAHAGRGRVICFTAAKGGAGTTTLAVNTALGIARRGQSVALADLDFHHGQVAAHLDLTAHRSTADLALALDPESPETGHALADVAVNHASGLTVYAAPARPDQASAVHADHVIELVHALRAAHPVVVIDAGSVPGTRALSLLGLADHSVVVVSPDIPGLRALTGMLATMADQGLTGEQNMFVVNRVFAVQTIERGDIEEHLGVGVALEVPSDVEGCQRAVNEGEPLLTLEPRSPVSLAVEQLCALVSGEAAEPAKRRLLGGLLSRRQG